MTAIGYLFPGQGVQYVGMGRDIYENFACAREIFHQASDLLGFDIAKLCFAGPENRLKETKNCQAAILTVSVATLSAINSASLAAKSMAGLSLGEYSALVSAESIRFRDAVKLVKKRGEFMEDAAAKFPGGMVSIIGLSQKEVEEICRECGAEIANLNCPGQIVISGETDSLSRAMDKAKSCGAKRAVLLDVSGPFHSSLMATASARIEEELRTINISPPKISVVSNVTAKFEDNPEEIKRNLTAQISHSTKWEESMKLLISCGISRFLEIGPGKVLRGLMRRIDPAVEVYNVETAEDIAGLKS